jgi:hypothetical protein
MKAIKILGLTVASVAAIAITLSVTGLGGSLFFMAFTAYNKPAGEFNSKDAVAPPDYNLPSNWAALPTKQDPADLVPDGIDVQRLQGEQAVDVFFIHPTGFLTSGSWTAPMDMNSGTEENTQFMLANQASAFNGCCNIYAPRYRQANIFAYFGSAADRDEVLGFAYQDVKRAFEHYLQHSNEGRPFIIASHSQGTHHATRLLKEVIDVSDLHKRMVSAYLIGSTLIPMPPSWFDSMNHIKACSAADELHCVVHWYTMPEGASPYERPAKSLCTNPLSWRVDEELAPASLNHGALLPAGTLNAAMGRSADVASNQSIELLGKPIAKLTSAQCKDGTLYVKPPQSSGFDVDVMGTYHQLDYSLFYMNIHSNAKLRSNKYLVNAGLAL